MDGDGGGDEEGKGKDARDEEDLVKQEQDSKEFIALQEEENLIKMNVAREVTDSKGLPMEEIIKQERKLSRKFSGIADILERKMAAAGT